MWSETCENSFLELKVSLTTAPVLIIPGGVWVMQFIVMPHERGWGVC